MELIKEEDIRRESLLQIAKQMMIAIRTAPKGKGLDTIDTIIVEGNSLIRIAEKMKEIGNRPDTTPAFTRDADNLLNSEVLLLVGTKIQPLGLAYCSLCGFDNCDEKRKYPEHPCVFNTGDLGIAIGSAVSKAMDARVDNRIMYTVGMAVKEIGIMDEDVKIVYGIPLSSSSKNIFFDRK